LKEVRAARQALKAAPQGDLTTFALKHIDAARAAEVLKAAYPNAPVRIGTDARTNAVIIQAGAADTQAIRRLLEALDVKPVIGFEDKRLKGPGDGSR
jgi:type II secretory pathway component GspD/PulD (secretin)